MIPLTSIYKKVDHMQFEKEAIAKESFIVDYLLLRKRKSLFPNCVKGNMMLTFQNKLLIVFHNICLQNTEQRPQTLADQNIC